MFESDELRRRAEQLVAPEPGPGDAVDGGAGDGHAVAELRRELQVSQVQLQMQQEELTCAHEELQQSRDRYFELFDLAPVAYLTVTRDLEIVDANHAAAKLFERSVHSLLSRPLPAFFAESDADGLHLFWRLVFATGERQRCELSLEGESGRQPVQLISVAPLDASGERERAYAALLDLSQIRRAQAALRSSQDRFRSVFDSSGGGVLVLRADGARWEVVEANDAVSQLLGYAPTDLIGMTLRHIAHREEGPRLADALRAARSSPRRRVALDLRLVRADHVNVWAHLTASWVCDDKGQPEVAILLIHDITDRKQAESALGEAEARQRAILAAATDGIVTVDDDGIVESLNAAAERILGCAAAETIGREIRHWIPSWSIGSGAEGAAAQGERNGVPLAVKPGSELEGRRDDGTVLPLHVTTSAIEVHGRRAHCLFVRDLTAAKQTEKALRHAERMEAVGTLAASVAHDFNNVLMGISGLTAVALEAADEVGPLRMYLEEIARSTQTGAAITKQLLELSRKRDAKPEVFEIDQHVDGLRAMLASMLGANITLDMRLGAEEARVRIDPAQLDQIVYNLASNARDAMPEGGNLIVETGLLELDDANPSEQLAERFSRGLAAGSYVILSVADTGYGMSEEIASRAFEPFYSTKQAGHGIGVGLFTVHGAVTRAGGEIELHTAHGAGARFDIVLPRVTSRITRSLPAVAAHDAACRGATVVVVEDDPLVRMTVRYYLEQRGCRVLETRDAREALECCQRFGGPIDLLLGDIVLPDGSGERIALEIRQLRPELKILFMSAYSHEQLLSQGRLVDHDRVLQKPFNAGTLIQAVGEVLAGRKAAQAQADEGGADGGGGGDGAGDDGASPEQGGGHEADAPRSVPVLVVEDQPAIRLSLCTALRQRGFHVDEADTGNAALDSARARTPAVVVIDATLPDVPGVDVAHTLRDMHADAVVIVMSAYSRAEVTRDRRLPTESYFVQKPIRIAELVRLVEDVATGRQPLEES